MTEIELQNLINKMKQDGETPWIEAKDSFGDIIKIGETISALANSASYHDQEYAYFIWGLKNETWEIIGTNFDLRKTKNPNADSSGNLEGEYWLKKIAFEHNCHWDSFEINTRFGRVYILKIKNCENKPITFLNTKRQKIAFIRINSNDDKLENHPEIERAIWTKKINSDWSAQVCEGATVEDLDEVALENAKKIWYDKTGNIEILNYSTNQVLTSLFDTDEILNATLILFGTKNALSKFGINNEISFEYRKNLKQIEYDDRRDFQQCFMLEYDKIWEKIDARNEVYRFQKGLIVDEIPKFSEIVLRESLLNCVAHRDYNTYYASSQIFIKQNPDFIEFQNPGKLPVKPNPVDLINHPSTPRNKKLAGAFQKMRMTNRAGMGIDLIFKRTIQEGKGMPIYTNFQDHFVFLKLNANLQDQKFLAYLYKITKETNYEFEVLELLALEEILQTGNTKQSQIKENLLKLGFIENSGTGKGSKLILSKKYYELSGDDINRYLDQKYDKFEHKDKLRRFVCEFGPKDTKEIMDRVKLPVSSRTKQRYLQQLVQENKIRIVEQKGKVFLYDKYHDN